MQTLSNTEKLKAISEYLQSQKKVNAKYSLSRNLDPVTFIAWIQQGVDQFKKLLPKHVYDPGGFYVVELEYAYATLEKRIQNQKKKEKQAESGQ